MSDILLFLRRAISRMFFHERPISGLSLSTGLLCGSYCVAVTGELEEEAGLEEEDGSEEKLPRMVAVEEAEEGEVTFGDTEGRTAAATCGAAVIGRDLCMML